MMPLRRLCISLRTLVVIPTVVILLATANACVSMVPEPSIEIGTQATKRLPSSPAVTPIPLPTDTPTSTTTPSNTPTITPQPTHTVAITPVPIATLAEPVRFDWALEEILAQQEIPSPIRGIITLVLNDRATEKHKGKLDKWLYELPYQDAPADVKDTFHRIDLVETVEEEAIIKHNEWIEQYNQFSIPLATATAEVIIRKTATVEELSQRAAEGVQCSDLDQSDTRLTSPIASYIDIYVGDFAREPLGHIARNAPPFQSIAFELEPNTLIRAPISGQVSFGWLASWTGDAWTNVRIENDDTEVSLILPVFWIPSWWAETDNGKRYSENVQNKCHDCAEINTQYFDKWVKRGQPLATYHHGYLSLGGFPASLAIIIGNAEGRPDLILDSPLWYGSYPTKCKEWRK